MIKLTDIYKRFCNNQILNGLNMSIPDGKVTALVGKNGAGKTTLIRIIAGIIKPDGGTIDIEEDLKVGILLGGDVNFYAKLTALENIRYFGELQGLTYRQITERIEEYDRVLKISSFINKKSGKLSRGMKQKIALLVSVISDPDILLLDEPSTGLDIEACESVIAFLEHLSNNGKTVLISTHNIFEISDLSDYISFLKNGVISKTVCTSEFFSGVSGIEKSKLLISEM